MYYQLFLYEAGEVYFSVHVKDIKWEYLGTKYLKIILACNEHNFVNICYVNFQFRKAAFAINLVVSDDKQRKLKVVKKTKQM